MTTASGRRRIWLLWGLIMAFFVARMALWLANTTLRPQSLSPVALLVPGFATVGAVVVARHHGQVVGWLFLALAGATALGGFCEAYAIRAYLTGPCQRATSCSGWRTGWAGWRPSPWACCCWCSRPAACPPTLAAGPVAAGGVDRLPGRQAHI